jgi:hypothetical protein
VFSNDSRAPNDRLLLAASKGERAAASAAKTVGSWKLLGSSSGRVIADEQPFPRPTENQTKSWSVHDGSFFAAAVREGKGHAPIEVQFLASERRAEASRRRRSARHAPSNESAPSRLAAFIRGWRQPLEVQLARRTAKGNSAGSDSVLPTAVRQAAERGELVPLREWLSASSERPVAALERGCVDGDVDLVQALLGAGVQADACGPRGLTMLMLASLAGEVATVRVLLSARAPVDMTDEKGLTALMYASHKGYLSIVRALHEAGARTDVSDNNGHNATFFATAGGDDALPGASERRGAVAAYLRTAGRRRRPMAASQKVAPAVAPEVAEAAARELIEMEQAAAAKATTTKAIQKATRKASTKSRC